ncbi:MAG: aminopeptidase, partial [Desulfobacterales bacterium]
MLVERHLERYADVLVWALQKARSKKFKKNDAILLRFGQPAIPLAEILYGRLVSSGMNPIPRLMPTPAMERWLYGSGNKK